MNIAKRLLLVRKLKKNLYEMSIEDLIAHQAERLQVLGEFVRESSPFYMEKFRDLDRFDLSSFPKMDKALMMENFDRINTRGLRKVDLLEFALKREGTNSMNLFRNEYSVGMSSGTSGNRGLTVLSKDEMEHYSCLLWARNGIPDRIRKKHILFALRINSPAFMEVRKFGVKIIYVDYTHPVEHLISKINRERLNILAGPPSLLRMIARQSGSIDHRIDCIISYAEVLTEETKRSLSDTFKAPVIQIYQGSEGFIGTTCNEGSLHMNEDVLLVNLEDVPGSDEGVKQVVVTDLYRSTQPVLRYYLNDLIEPGNTRCPCGSSFRTIRKIHGRADDIFILKGKDGSKRYLFPDYVRRAIITASGDIEDYQAIQHSIGDIELRLILKNGSDRKAIRDEVLKRLDERARSVKGMIKEVRFSDERPAVNRISGKMIRVVRNFKEEL